MKRLTFKGKGFATEANASHRLGSIAGLVPNSKALIAVEYGRYFPVVIIHEDDMHNARSIAEAGVFVTN